MSDIIDFDCGPIVSGKATPEEMSDKLLELLLRIASGETRTKAEVLGQDDFIRVEEGVSL